MADPNKPARLRRLYRRVLLHERHALILSEVFSMKYSKKRPAYITLADPESTEEQSISTFWRMLRKGLASLVDTISILQRSHKSGDVRALHPRKTPYIIPVFSIPESARTRYNTDEISHQRDKGSHKVRKIYDTQLS